MAILSVRLRQFTAVHGNNYKCKLWSVFFTSSQADQTQEPLGNKQAVISIKERKGPFLPDRRQAVRGAAQCVLESVGVAAAGGEHAEDRTLLLITRPEQDWWT